MDQRTFDSNVWLTHVPFHYENSGPIGPYLRAARWFPLAIDPFANLEDVLYEGMEAEFAESQGDHTSSQSEENANRWVCTGSSLSYSTP